MKADRDSVAVPVETTMIVGGKVSRVIRTYTATINCEACNKTIPKIGRARWCSDCKPSRDRELTTNPCEDCGGPKDRKGKHGRSGRKFCSKCADKRAAARLPKSHFCLVCGIVDLKGQKRQICDQCREEPEPRIGRLPVAPLVPLIERWIRVYNITHGDENGNGGGLAMLVLRSRVGEKTIQAMRKGAYKTCHVDVADRLCLALGEHLDTVFPMEGE